MPTGTIRPNAPSAGDTSSRWTAKVWDNINVEAIKDGLEDGIVLEYDFAKIKPSTNVNAAEAWWGDGIMLFGSDGATATLANGVGLANGMTFGSDGDNEGIGFRILPACFRISRADRPFAMEWCLQRSAIDDTKNGFFVGLIENSAITATSPIAAAGTLADLNFVGFHALEGDGDKLDLVYKANTITQVSQMTDAVTLAAATDVRIGLTYNPDADAWNSKNYVFRWWLNGQIIADTGTSAGSLGYKQIPSSAGDDFPNDVAMGPIFTMLNATASTPGTVTVRRMRAAQYF